MKLLYGILLISLLGSLICKKTILIEQHENFNHQLYSEICKSYANTPEKPSHLKISHASHTEDQGFQDSDHKDESNYIPHARTVECKGDLKQTWLSVYPVAPCLFDLYGNTYLFLFYSEETKIALPDNYLRENVRCSRFFKHLPYLPDNSDFKGEGYQHVRELIVKVNELTRDQEYDSALPLFEKIINFIESNEKKPNHDKTLFNYIYENAAFVAIQVYNKYLPRQEEDEQTSKGLKELKDNGIKVLVEDRLRLDENSSTFFQRFLLGLYSFYEYGNEKAIEVFNLAAELNQGDFQFSQYFVELDRNDLAIEYLQNALNIDIPEFKHYKDRIQSYLNPIKRKRKFKY
jgi:tetratricopeptide (TPR) repeat protein